MSSRRPTEHSAAQFELDQPPAYSVREWVQERLQGFRERQRARDARRAARRNGTPKPPPPQQNELDFHAEPQPATIRGRVLAFIRDRGDAGATDDEMQVALDMNPSTQRPRRVELWNAGLIARAEITRPTRSGRQAKVWIAS